MKPTTTKRLPSLRKTMLSLAACTLLAGAAQAQTVWGLAPSLDVNAQALVSFDAATPGTIASRVLVTGIAAGQVAAGLDFRPATGELYMLGYNPGNTQAQLYVVNRTTGLATAVAAAITLNLGADPSRIGFDFNPTVDRIRVVVSATRGDFRLHPVTGAVVATDGMLAYAATDPNAAQTPGVGSVAYTNSYIGSSATLLYDIDEANSRLVTQNPPNNGTLNTVGGLGFALGSQVTDLDISFNATTGANTLYLTTATATTIADGLTRLYTLNTTTGAATLVGQVGNTGTYVSDIAFQIDRPATLPAITGQLVYALAGTNLITFDSAQPTLVRTATGITGVDAAQTLVGLDVRPLNNALYALGYNATAQTGQLYTLNATTGVATPTSAAIALALGTGSIGFDFNPTVDRIRVVGANRANYRLNPVTGTLAATDGQLTYFNLANNPSIGAVAYTNSFTGASAATGTTLYTYDEVLNSLNTQNTLNPPQDGQQTIIGFSNLVVNTTTPNVDLDIYSTGVGANTAYLVATSGTSANSRLYTLNFTSGSATTVGVIGNGITVRDIAVAAATGVATTARNREELVAGLSLSPNPVADAAQLTFTLPRAAQVTLVVTDALGRQVETLNAGTLAAGTQTLRWNGKAAQRQGVYFFTLLLDGQPAGTRRGVLLK